MPTFKSVRPVLIALQLAPPSIDLKTPPPPVPANMVWSLEKVGEGAIDNMVKLVSPVLIVLQLLPLLVDLKTPPPSVPAKTVWSLENAGEIAVE